MFEISDFPYRKLFSFLEIKVKLQKKYICNSSNNNDRDKTEVFNKHANVWSLASKKQLSVFFAQNDTFYKLNNSCKNCQF